MNPDKNDRGLDLIVLWLSAVLATVCMLAAAVGNMLAAFGYYAYGPELFVGGLVAFAVALLATAIQYFMVGRRRHWF